ncbi:hypothetical protein MUTS6_42540 [Escherichia coli]|nr:hypothetical protein MUTS6_42540 [Escherichia coli]
MSKNTIEDIISIKVKISKHIYIGGKATEPDSFKHKRHLLLDKFSTKNTK